MERGLDNWRLKKGQKGDNKSSAYKVQTLCIGDRILYTKKVTNNIPNKSIIFKHRFLVIYHTPITLKKANRIIQSDLLKN